MSSNDRLLLTVSLLFVDMLTVFGASKFVTVSLLFLDMPTLFGETFFLGGRGGGDES